MRQFCPLQGSSKFNQANQVNRRAWPWRTQHCAPSTPYQGERRSHGIGILEMVKSKERGAGIYCKTPEISWISSISGLLQLECTEAFYYDNPEHRIQWKSGILLDLWKYRSNSLYSYRAGIQVKQHVHQWWPVTRNNNNSNNNAPMQPAGASVAKCRQGRTGPAIPMLMISWIKSWQHVANKQTTP